MKTTNNNRNIIFSRTNDNAGDQISIPKMKIADNKIENRKVIVRHELIMPCLLDSFGKNRRIPKLNPSNENANNKFAAEMSAVASPTSCEE